MGRDKRRERLWGEGGPTLLERMVELGGRCCAECLVVLGDPEAWPDLPARLVRDEMPGAGPLAGLASGLAAMRYERALVLACDLPLLQPALLRALLDLPGSPAALVPTHQGADQAPQPEPLLAVYRRSCLPYARACLADGQRSMRALLDRVPTRYLSPDEWRPYDPDGRSFYNLNRPADLAVVEQLLGGTG
jgi:molybdopterin-guanine dinucleotide biosynthesis protein A